jgi:hypothetical protein
MKSPEPTCLQVLGVRGSPGTRWKRRSGLYPLRRLMTHKSLIMTQRYAYLRNEALRSGGTSYRGP